MSGQGVSGGGDSDIAAVGALVADPGRCRILLALDDGRALPASRLAAEAGVSAATASSHLGKLTTAGLLTVEPHGRHRYYRLAGPAVGDLIEALQRLAPAAPVTSLRQSSRARALRRARTCYDHIAGRLGVELMRAMIERGHVAGGDGTHDPAAAVADARTGYGKDVDYALTASGKAFLAEFGVRIPERRRVMRYCVDWSEQRHHLSGAVGRGLLDRVLELEWVRRAGDSRAVHVTEAGAGGFARVFGVRL
ncbi:transcriptional regulator [Streptomyces sulfonofaciens]|uniref:Transcriptional regulator n=1 Tax=Streptomyces sulfonofaciens TaxID=68272 RepID=A0A919L1N0_9ACTN|nr:transcriptional regulator [Streptomyces sulfonofaciens]